MLRSRVRAESGLDRRRLSAATSCGLRLVLVHAASTNNESNMYASLFIEYKAAIERAQWNLLQLPSVSSFAAFCAAKVLISLYIPILFANYLINSDNLGTHDPYAYQRPDGVFVVPIGCLKD